MTTRRAFLGTLAGALLAVPLGAEGQTKVYRVGFLAQGSPPSAGQPRFFWTAMRELGYLEGQNLILEYRYAEGRNDRFPGFAADLVALKPDVIVADSTPAAIAAAQATATIPIVIVNVSDPVGSALVASLARPGGNVTGTTDFGTELAVKGVELMHAAVPKATSLAVLMSDNPVHPFQLKEIQSAATKRGLTVLPTMVRSFGELEKAFVSMARQKAGALIWLGGAPISTEQQRHQLVDLAAKTKLPTLYPGSRWWVEAGGLMSYGMTSSFRWGRTATYVAKILKGAKPADLPVEQPSEFELVVNLKTAKALGLTIPPSLLQRADEVIQ
jgi:putative ABC transport system substrate-binding protein